MPKHQESAKKLVTLIDTIDLDFTIISLTETWLQEYNHDLYEMEGFTHISQTRQNKTGGGVSLFIRNNVNFIIRDDLNCNTIDSQFLWVELPSSDIQSETNMIVGVIYRRPGSNIEIFNEKLSEILHKIKLEKKECQHAGDYNIDLLKTDSHPQSNEFILTNFSNSFIPQISKPTRVTNFR